MLSLAVRIAVIAMTKTKKRKIDLSKDRSTTLLEGVKLWASYWRSNPHRFAEDYLNIKLKLFQKILIFMMMQSNYFMFLASRSLGKTFLVAVFCVIRCILYPHTKIVVASGTRSQANEVLLKITEELMKAFDWGSENLKNEIESASVGQNRAEIVFKNGSWIKVATASDSGRGMRANILVLDEFRLLDKTTVDTVLKRFLGTPRQPAYLSKPEYEHLVERNKEIYMSSAWWKTHWSYDKAKAYTVNMLDDRKEYFICGLPYQVAIREGLLSREQVEDEMSETDFDEMTFRMEMEVEWLGNDGEALFKFDDITNQRKIKDPLYPFDAPMADKKKLPLPLPNERRILSVDIALMGSQKRDNDACSIILNRALPLNDKYSANIVFLENVEDVKSDELALYVRKLYDWFDCTDLVVDTNGIGLATYDCLIKDIIDPRTGIVYPALSCRNNEEMAKRCAVPNAPKVIWSIKASQAFNSDSCLLLRSGFQQGRINLLVNEFEAEELLKDNFENYKSLLAEEQLKLKLPYIHTTLLIYELVNLGFEVHGTSMKVKEGKGMRKDRYSSLAYNYWVQTQLEREVLAVSNLSLDIQHYANKIRNLNKKPIMY